ncbi:MAG TPA: hypothetical protein VGT07_11290, partial [Steroidobacteraceae bacterium]|nr:hypothetical protein [Steroidobacteraceae bacterium]
MAFAFVCGAAAVHAQVRVIFQAAPMYSYEGAPYASTLTQAWALTQASRDTCDPSNCLNGNYVTNLRPQTTGSLAVIQNGQWADQIFDLVVCDTPKGGSTICNTDSNDGFIQVNWLCPPSGGGGSLQTGSNPTTYIEYCAVKIPKPPKACPCTKVGEPIDAANGEETFAETDY